MITAATLARAVAYHLGLGHNLTRYPEWVEKLKAAEAIAAAMGLTVDLEEDLEETKLPTVTVRVDGRTFHLTITEEPQP